MTDFIKVVSGESGLPTEALLKTIKRLRNDKMEVPGHVAIILDGNRRWARSKGMPSNFGHKKGAENVETIIRAAHEMGIKYLTVYAFSTENWSRSSDEVAALMKLLRNYLKNCVKRARDNNMKVRVIGDRKGLDPDIQKSIEELEEASRDYDGINFQIALNYGSRDEIIRGVARLAEDVKEGRVSSEEITEKLFSGYLDTENIPDPDLMIRTGGEQRLSNYLLWQLAYAEFYFTDVTWPDFSVEELQKAVEEYNRRNRRFGGK